jgi:hypothetical protein
VNQQASLLSCQAAMSTERQAEFEYNFEKTKPISRRQNECKVFAKNILWQFMCFETAKKQSQTNPTAGLWPEPGRAKCQTRNKDI